MRSMLVLVVVSGSASAGPTELHPLKMAGPFKTLVESCKSAPPCGATDMDAKGNLVKPPKKPDCSTFSEDGGDVNATDASGNRTKLSHKMGADELRLGAVTCAVPRGLRYEHAIYYGFVKRAEGWYRSEPLFAYDYNDKYCSGSLVVRWNDQPGRTFAGIAMGLQCVACNKQGDETDVTELMVRFEHGDAAPIVFPALPVGERYAQSPNTDIDKDIDCKAIKQHVSLDEKWSGVDDLVLTATGKWHPLKLTGGAIEAGFNGSATAAAPAGAYHFTR